MHTQFSRLTIAATVLLLVAVLVPHQAQAQVEAESQSYPIAAAIVTYLEASANAQELSARAHGAWAQAGGTCGEGYDTETCIEQAADNSETAESYRAVARDIRVNLSRSQRTIRREYDTR